MPDIQLRSKHARTAMRVPVRACRGISPVLYGSQVQLSAAVAVMARMDTHTQSETQYGEVRVHTPRRSASSSVSKACPCKAAMGLSFHPTLSAAYRFHRGGRVPNTVRPFIHRESGAGARCGRDPPIGGWVSWVGSAVRPHFPEQAPAGGSRSHGSSTKARMGPKRGG